MAVTLVLLIAACIAVLADAYTTRLGLIEGRREANPVRRWLIRVLGMDVGTWGVSLVCCGLLIWSYAASPHSPLAGISYATVASVFAYVSFGNHQRSRA